MSLTRVQIRVQIESTLEEYVAQEGWSQARLLRCPLHPQGCRGFASHGTYLRKYPIRFRIARYYCREGQTTFGLIPDFAASHVAGTLGQIEAAAIVHEAEGSIYKAAAIVRPPKIRSGDREPITEAATSQWILRRVHWVRSILITVAGLFPELFVGCEMTVTAFRTCLRSETVLMDLREICSDHLSHLPPPVGFGSRQKSGKPINGAVQQSKRSDRPP